jgi:glycerol-3-phosphate dehydrogenase (NAD(P)+)
MARIVDRHRGRRETVFDLAGVGDLYVTSASGRNGQFGRRIGSGGDPAREYERMYRSGEVAEGYHTLELLMEYLGQGGGDGVDELPMLRALSRTVIGGGKPGEEFDRLVVRAAELH